MPGQCVIVSDLELMEPTQELWLDGLYIRHHRTNRTDTAAVIGCFESCNLWMTTVTIQGDGSQDPTRGAIWIETGQVYAEGVASQFNRPEGIDVLN
jgi:hypothetical protein